MSNAEKAGAIGVFLIWLSLFAGGILVDTLPYRMAISPSGAAAGDSTAAALVAAAESAAAASTAAAASSATSPADAGESNAAAPAGGAISTDGSGVGIAESTVGGPAAPAVETSPTPPAAPAAAESTTTAPGAPPAALGDVPGDRSTATVAASAAGPAAPGLLVSWIVVMLWFLPLNLALLCATAGVLGAFGSRANLQDDGADFPARDNTNPYISALLRGFFVYLILISGLLLLDNAPFANPDPEQYIRFAGLLSLFGFVVNYNPQLFSKLITIAAERIQTRGEDGRGERSEHTDVQIARTSVEVASIQTSVDLEDQPTAAAPENRAAEALVRLTRENGGAE